MNGENEMNPRSCIVSRQAGDAGQLIRFVADPDGKIVADLKQKLPGRGCWVTARRSMVDEAVRKGLFNRALKGNFDVPQDLAAETDRMLSRAALGAIGLARKAGQLVSGFTKVNAAVRDGSAILVLHSLEAAEDGIRKLRQAATATRELGGPDIPSVRLFTTSQFDLALGGENVVHAAAIDGGAGRNAAELTRLLHLYREDSTF